MGITIEHIIGPVGGLVILFITARILYVWLRGTIDKRIEALERELMAVKTELDHCQSQHNITTQELLKLSNENGYLRGRLESITTNNGGVNRENS